MENKKNEDIVKSSVRIPRELYRSIKIYCAENDYKMNEFFLKCFEHVINDKIDLK
ncbi:MAG: hypothetical protein GY754_32115 [bacterium]|nr:hypothetical protein [bacterium]